MSEKETPLGPPGEGEPAEKSGGPERTIIDDIIEQGLAGQAEAAGVKVYQMRHFRMEETDREPAMLILGYGALSQEKIKEGVALLKKVWL